MRATLSRRLVLSASIILGTCCSSATKSAAAANHFEGKYCSGIGDAAWLALIDDSFACFHANPNVPNLTMVY